MEVNLIANIFDVAWLTEYVCIFYGGPVNFVSLKIVVNIYLFVIFFKRFLYIFNISLSFLRGWRRTVGLRLFEFIYPPHSLPYITHNNIYTNESWRFRGWPQIRVFCLLLFLPTAARWSTMSTLPSSALSSPRREEELTTEGMYYNFCFRHVYKPICTDSFS